MSKRTRRSAEALKAGGLVSMWEKVKTKKENANEGVKPIKEMERGDGQLIHQFYENTFTAFTEVQKGGDLEDVEEDQRKLLGAVSSLALQEQGSLPSKQLFSSLMQCISENRSARLSLDAYALLRKLQQKFPATTLISGTKIGQALPYLQEDKQVWTPLDAIAGPVPLRGTAAAANIPPPPRAGSRPRTNKDGNIARQGDFFAVLDHVVEDVLDESEAPPTETASSARGRRNKKPSSDGPEVDEAATQQAQLEAAEALAIQRLGSGLMFKYLVGLLYDDLSCRLAVYQAHNCGSDFKLLVESLLYRLLVNSRTGSQRDRIWTSIFTIIKAAAPERGEEVPEPVAASQTETTRDGGDAMEVDPDPAASQTPTSKKGKKKRRGKRSSVTSASLQEATTSSRNQIVVETACDAAVEKRKDDLAAQYGLSCSRQDLCTTAQTLLASMLELTAVMENPTNMWKANDLRKELVGKLCDEFGPNRTYDPRLDTQRHFLETMLSQQQKARFIIDYFHSISPRGSEAWKVLDRKGPKSTVRDLLPAVRENEKKLLSTLQSTPDELALLVSHAVQATMTMGIPDTGGLKRDFHETCADFKEALPAAERKGRHLSAASHAALVAATITSKLAMSRSLAS